MIISKHNDGNCDLINIKMNIDTVRIYQRYLILDKELTITYNRRLKLEKICSNW